MAPGAEAAAEAGGPAAAGAATVVPDPGVRPDPLAPAFDPQDPLQLVQRYMQVRSSSRPQWTADGTRILYATKVTGTVQVWSVPREGGVPQQVTFFEDNVSAFATSPTRDEMVVALARGGDERTQLYRVSNDGMYVQVLAVAAGVIHTLGDWSDDGRRVAYATNARDRATFDVHVLDLGTGEIRRVVEDEGHWSAGEFSPDGRSLFVSRTRSNQDEDLYVADVATGERRPVAPVRGEVRWTAARWGEGGQSAWLLSDEGRDFLNLVRVDTGRKGGKPRFVEQISRDRDAIALTRDRSLMATTTQRAGWSSLELRDLRGGPPPAPPRLPEGVYSDLTFSPDGRWLALTVSAPTLPADVWLVDVLEGVGHPLVRSSRAGVPESAFVPAETVRVPTSDGLEVAALLFQPAKRSGRLPLVVRAHGGPEGQWRPVFDPVTQYLARRGYAVLLPDVRGSTGYGRRFARLDNVEKREDSVRDLAECVRYVVDRGIADPQRVAVMGGSYGGYMVLAGMTLYPELFAAGIDVVGIANFQSFLANTGAWRRALRAAEYGDPVKDAELLRRISPLHRVDRIRAPLMVVHGLNDPRVPVSEAEQIVAALRARGAPVEYLRFDDEGHGVSKLPNQLSLYPRLADFLDRALSPRRPGDGTVGPGGSGGAAGAP